MEHKQLENIGLTKNQAQIYNVLLENGPLQAHSIKRRVRINRSLVYVVLNELIDLSLVTRDDSKKVAIFKPNSPKVLEKMVLDKQSSSELARSAFDSIFYQMQQQIAENQVKRQMELNIKVKVISPSISTLSKRIPLDKKRLTERRILSKDIFKTPSQLIIYNDVVSITTYKEPLVTTVITHEDIAQTFTTMFMYIWRTSLPETQSLQKELEK